MENTAAYEERLEEEKQTLEAELTSIARLNPTTNEWEAKEVDTGQEADEGDAASLIEGYENNVSVLRELAVRYAAVMLALGKIKDGTYGSCVVGGENIEEKRLMADPAAVTCIAHQG